MRVCVCVTAIAVGTCMAGRTLAQATFQGLGDLPGGIIWSVPQAITDDGTVVVGVASSEFGTSGGFHCCEAFRWSEETGMVGLGDLPGGDFESNAEDVSRDGSIIVGQAHNGGDVATVWSPDALFTVITPQSLSIYGSATGVSADGEVVVGWHINPAGKRDAFRTRVRPRSGITGLGDLPGDKFKSHARDVSADGSVVVGWGTSDHGQEAFRWTTSEGMVGLGDLPGGEFWSEALAVSADGLTIVGQSDSTLGREAFRWTARDGMRSLGLTPRGTHTPPALGVSADGSVIVGGGHVGGAFLVYTWDAVNGTRSIRTAVEDSGIDLRGWSLFWAGDVSADGTVVTGRGTNPDGFDEAWIATIPRPTCESPADFDCDGDIDLADYLEFVQCFTSPNESPASACGGADTDGDNDVDLADLVSFQAQFTGPR